MDFATKTRDIGRIYKIRGGKKEDPKELVALVDVNIEIPRRELFGLLGPNGAGKTNLIKILTTHYMVEAEELCDRVAIINQDKVLACDTPTRLKQDLQKEAMFPLEVLPAWLRPIGFAMPLTYWLELMRRSFVGPIAKAFPTLADFSNVELLGILSGLTIVFCVLGFVVFRYYDHRVRELGFIDRVTNY